MSDRDRNPRKGDPMAESESDSYIQIIVDEDWEDVKDKERKKKENLTEK